MNSQVPFNDRSSLNGQLLDQLGVTLLELLLSISILLLLSALAVPMGLRYLASTNHTTTVDQITSSLRTAQTNAMAEKGSGVWGVCLVSGDTIRFFADSCDTPTFQLNYPIPNTVAVNNLPTIIFDNVRGEPNQSATVTVNSNQYSSSIIINAAGGILVE